MYRNLSRRVELIVPIKDPKLRDRLKGVLDAHVADNVNARELNPDGAYMRVRIPDGDRKRDAQLEFAVAQADFN